MNINKYLRSFLLATATLFVSLVCMGDVQATQVPSEDVAANVKSLWVANNLTGLKTYLSQLEAKYPDFIPALAASAFYDSVVFSKVDQAKAKLISIKSVTDKEPNPYSDVFKRELDFSIKFLADAIRMQTDNGRSAATWVASANAQEVRNDWEEGSLPILDLIASCPKTFLTNIDSVPPAPAGLVGSPGDTQVILTWNSSDGATSYIIYRGTSPGAEGGSPFASGVGATSFKDTSLTNGTTYYYKVKAINLAGLSADSNEASATPFPASPEPEVIVP